MRQPTIIVHIFFCSILCILLANGEIDKNGRCSLFLFTPFTIDGKENPHFSGTVHNNLGFSHLASAVMAMEHFNARDSSIVPELNAPSMENCSIQFETNSSRFFDSGGIGKMGLEQMQETILHDGPPCAVAGPYNDEPIRDLSIVATSLKVPIVSHRGRNVNLSVQKSFPFLSQTYPSTFGITGSLLSYFLQRGRNDFVAVLYSLDDPTVQKQIVVCKAFDNVGIRTRSFGYINSKDDMPPPFPGASIEDWSLASNMKRIKETNFRTIVVISDGFLLDSSLPKIAAEANANGLTNGDHLWCFFGGLELDYFSDSNIREDPVVSKLLRGAALLLPVESFLARPSKDKFLTSWRQQDYAFLDQVKASNPIKKGMPGFYNVDENYFSSENPEAGAGFLYDAVMSIGIGACLAQANTIKGSGKHGVISGVDHQIGIQSVAFQGASGQVVIRPSPSVHGTRDSTNAIYGIFNLLPPNDKDGKGYVLTDYLEPGGVQNGFLNPWTNVKKFVYADGSTVPPPNHVPEQNYLSPSIQIFGICMFSIAALLILLSASWIIINRKHRILAASQPEFLLMICFGSLLLDSAIFMNSFDESYGWSDESLSRTCIAGPWLAFMGYLLTYGALFSKLWRINKILQFVRVAKVDIKHVIWPLRIMGLTTIAILATWTYLAPFEWVREEVDEISGESFGRCHGENTVFWFTPAIFIIFVATALTLRMAWKTKDVDEAYSESKWVFVLILVQMQTLVFCSPLIVILKDLSTNGRYIGFTVMIWTFPMTNIMLIMVPKVVAFYSKNDPSKNNKKRRGSKAGGGISISGIPSHSTQISTKESEYVQDGGIIGTVIGPEMKLSDIL